MLEKAVTTLESVHSVQNQDSYFSKKLGLTKMKLRFLAMRHIMGMLVLPRDWVMAAMELPPIGL